MEYSLVMDMDRKLPASAFFSHVSITSHNTETGDQRCLCGYCGNSIIECNDTKVGEPQISEFRQRSSGYTELIGQDKKKCNTSSGYTELIGQDQKTTYAGLRIGFLNRSKTS